MGLRIRRLHVLTKGRRGRYGTRQLRAPRTFRTPPAPARAVWILGEWHFLGAGEPDAAGLDHAWFYPDPVRKAVPGAGMRSVFATSWAPTPGGLHFPLYYALEKTYVHAYEVTPRYIA